MNLLNFIRIDDIIIDSQSETIEAVLEELALKFPDNIQKKILKLLIEREEQSSTAICNQVAIPHCKLSDLQEIKIIVLRTAKAFDCIAHDQKLTKLFFLIVSHPKASKDHIKILAKIGRMIKDQKKVDLLMNALSSQDFYDTLQKFED